MEQIWSYLENLLSKLPPLLQLLAGVFVTLGAMKIIILITDYYDKKQSKD